MTVTLELKPEIEQGLLNQAKERGLSVDSYLQEILAEVIAAAATKAGNNLELPVMHLGAMGALNRQEIYDDAA